MNSNEFPRLIDVNVRKKLMTNNIQNSMIVKNKEESTEDENKYNVRKTNYLKTIVCGYFSLLHEERYLSNR